MIVIYNSFQNGDFVLNLLRHILVHNEMLNKIDNKYSYNLFVQGYINIYKNFTPPESDLDTFVYVDHLKPAALENWHLNYQMLVSVFMFIVDLGLFLIK